MPDPSVPPSPADEREPMNLDDVFIHKGGSEKLDGACVMNAVHAMWLIEQHGTITRALTDHPACTERMIANAAISVNDRLGDTERQRLRPLIPRLYMARQVVDETARKRVLVRVACWCARSVLHLVRDENRDVCERAIVAAENWLDGEATTQECRNASASAATASAAAADAAYAAASASAYAYAADSAAAAATASASAYAAATASASAYAYAADAATASATATATADPVLWLDELLDQYDKARAAEGVLHEDLIGTQAGGS